MPEPSVIIDRAETDALNVRVVGELEAEQADELLAVLDGRTGGRLTVDLREVSFIDSGGMHALADLHERGQRGGTAVTLQVSNPTMLKAFDAIGFLEALDIERMPPPDGGDPQLAT